MRSAFLLFLAILQVRPPLYGRAESYARPSIPITIRLYDQVPLDDGYLQGAKAIPTRVFNRVAVNVSWRDVPNPFVGPPTLDYSNNPPAPCLHEIGVKIVRSAPPGTDSKMLAMTLPRSRGALQIVVYWDRVQNFHRSNCRAGSLCLNVTSVLGYVLVHEVAHVLFGSAEHSETGLMRAHWGEAELLKMEQDQLGFFKAQGTTIYHRCGEW
jgi:hypothetical protein